MGGGAPGVYFRVQLGGFQGHAPPEENILKNNPLNGDDWWDLKKIKIKNKKKSFPDFQNQNLVHWVEGALCTVLARGRRYADGETEVAVLTL